MTTSSRRLIELSFLALLDSGIDYRGRKIGSFTAGTNAEALAHVRFFHVAIVESNVSARARTTSTTAISGPGPILLQIEWPTASI